MAKLMAMFVGLLGLRKRRYVESDLPPFFFSTDWQGRMVYTNDHGKTWKPVVGNL